MCVEQLSIKFIIKFMPLENLVVTGQWRKKAKITAKKLQRSKKETQRKGTEKTT
jgi:hypothetical protein